MKPALILSIVTLAHMQTSSTTTSCSTQVLSQCYLHLYSNDKTYGKIRVFDEQIEETIACETNPIKITKGKGFMPVSISENGKNKFGLVPGDCGKVVNGKLKACLCCGDDRNGDQCGEEKVETPQVLVQNTTPLVKETPKIDTKIQSPVLAVPTSVTTYYAPPALPPQPMPTENAPTPSITPQNPAENPITSTKTCNKLCTISFYRMDSNEICTASLKSNDTKQLELYRCGMLSFVTITKKDNIIKVSGGMDLTIKENECLDTNENGFKSCVKCTEECQ